MPAPGPDFLRSIGAFLIGRQNLPGQPPATRPAQYGDLHRDRLESAASAGNEAAAMQLEWEAHMDAVHNARSGWEAAGLWAAGLSSAATLLDPQGKEAASRMARPSSTYAPRVPASRTRNAPGTPQTPSTYIREMRAALDKMRPTLTPDQIMRGEQAIIDASGEQTGAPSETRIDRKRDLPSDVNIVEGQPRSITRPYSLDPSPVRPEPGRQQREAITRFKARLAARLQKPDIAPDERDRIEGFLRDYEHADVSPWEAWNALKRSPSGGTPFPDRPLRLSTVRDALATTPQPEPPGIGGVMINETPLRKMGMDIPDITVGERTAAIMGHPAFDEYQAVDKRTGKLAKYLGPDARAAFYPAGRAAPKGTEIGPHPNAAPAFSDMHILNAAGQEVGTYDPHAQPMLERDVPGGTLLDAKGKRAAAFMQTERRLVNLDEPLPADVYKGANKILNNTPLLQGIIAKGPKLRVKGRPYDREREELAESFSRGLLPRNTRVRTLIDALDTVDRGAGSALMRALGYHGGIGIHDFTTTYQQPTHRTYIRTFQPSPTTPSGHTPTVEGVITNKDVRPVLDDMGLPAAIEAQVPGTKHVFGMGPSYFDNDFSNVPNIRTDVRDILDKFSGEGGAVRARIAREILRTDRGSSHPINLAEDAARALIPGVKSDVYVDPSLTEHLGSYWRGRVRVPNWIGLLTGLPVITHELQHAVDDETGRLGNNDILSERINDELRAHLSETLAAQLMGFPPTTRAHRAPRTVLYQPFSSVERNADGSLRYNAWNPHTPPEVLPFSTSSSSLDNPTIPIWLAKNPAILRRLDLLRLYRPGFVKE